MTVLPGSLDYLYYNGILDHIPYEAYEMAPVQQPSPMNGTQYLDMAAQGNLYNTYTNPDTFVRRNNYDVQTGQNYSISQHTLGINNGIGQDSTVMQNAFGIEEAGRNANYEVMANGEDGKSFRESLVNAAKSTANNYSNAPTYIKGIISGGIIIGTLFCLLKGKKKPAVDAESSGVYSKLNPLNWFKK